ncbi:ATP-binding protein [Streptomyces sp. NBC_01285]|uniref:ATP-binding protein n=1 Tax=Streptomyces sp. NBC_01285 TaxID=2903813 RepID=UPI002B1D4FDB|nr:ATP-binding protein [Streptomyces sp. NBC_01285]
MTAAQEKAPAPEPVLREDRLDYTPTARSVSLCRRRAVRLVSEWGYPNHVAEVALLVSELATNALLHGSMRGRLFRVHLILTATTLRIEVSDPPGASGCPACARPGTTTATGADCSLSPGSPTAGASSRAPSARRSSPNSPCAGGRTWLCAPEARVARYGARPWAN